MDPLYSRVTRDRLTTKSPTITAFCLSISHHVPFVVLATERALLWTMSGSTLLRRPQSLAQPPTPCPQRVAKSTYSTSWTIFAATATHESADASFAVSVAYTSLMAPHETS